MKKFYLKFLNQSLWLFFVLILPFSIAAQKQSPALENKALTTAQDYKLNSKLMTREMPYRVILPANYKSSDQKTAYSTVYLLHGLTGHFDNWADKTKLKEYAAKYNYIFVMPEGNNGWYSDSSSLPNDKYESYIVQELIPEIDKNFRTVADRNHRAIAGLSMGGYGSIKFGLKYPQMFALVGSFSGALGAASWTEKEVGTKGTIAESLLAVYGAADTKTRVENDIFKMVKEISADRMKTMPFVYMACGTEDFLFKNNRDFVDLLVEKKIPHEYREHPGGHDWKFWDAQIKEFLEVSENFLK
jgi:S-formylglutathione hydrolase FrmB